MQNKVCHFDNEQKRIKTFEECVFKASPGVMHHAYLWSVVLIYLISLILQSFSGNWMEIFITYLQRLHYFRRNLKTWFWLSERQRIWTSWELWVDSVLCWLGFTAFTTFRLPIGCSIIQLQVLLLIFLMISSSFFCSGWNGLGLFDVGRRTVKSRGPNRCFNRSQGKNYNTWRDQQ